MPEREVYLPPQFGHRRHGRSDLPVFPVDNVPFDIARQLDGNIPDGLQIDGEQGTAGRLAAYPHSFSRFMSDAFDLFDALQIFFEIYRFCAAASTYNNYKVIWQFSACHCLPCASIELVCVYATPLLKRFLVKNNNII